MGMKIKNKVIGCGRPLICVPVMGRTKEDIVEEAAYLSRSCADMIEWRVDAFEHYADFNRVREVLKEVALYMEEKIFLYTFRTRKQGGEADPEEELLDDLHDLAAESGCVDLLDLEYFAGERPQRKIRRLQKAGLKIVASHHDFEMTPGPEVMRMLLDRMAAGGADLVKLAVMPECEKDVLNLLEVTCQFAAQNPDTPIISMSMGSLGGVSRICGETFGSCVTFGCNKKASAPGQFPMDELNEILNSIHKSKKN